MINFINSPLPIQYPMSTSKEQTMDTAFSKGILPIQWKNKPENEKLRFLDNYLTLRTAAKDLTNELAQKNIETDYRNFLAQKFNESEVLTKETGKNNWGGIKLKSTARDLLKQDLNLETQQLIPNKSYSFQTPLGDITGATYKKTFETLDAKDKQKAEKEAKNTYGKVFGQKIITDTEGNPILFRQNGKWNVRIMDLFPNFTSSAQFMEEFKNQIRKRVLSK